MNNALQTIAPTLTLAWGLKANDATLNEWVTTWGELADALAAPEIGDKDGPYWCPGFFGQYPTRRKRANVQSVALLVLDVEAKGESPPPLREAMQRCKAQGWRASGHTTHSHRPEAPRYRLVLQPNRPLQPDELKPAVQSLAQRLELGQACDLAASGDPARLFFLPRVPDEQARAQFEADTVDGDAVDVEALLNDQAHTLPLDRHTDSRPQAPADAYTLAALQNAVQTVATAADGARNNALNGAAYGLARLEAAGRIPPGVVAPVLTQAAQAVGLPAGEVRSTLASAQRAGGQRPNWQGMAGAHTGEVGDNWPEPSPLPDGLPRVAPFDPDLLPEALRAWVADIAHRMQCPPDFTAVGAVVALSSLIGARAVVKPKARDDWAVVPNLWGALVGRPGVMKSPALGEVLKTLHRLEATERELWKAAHDEWAKDAKVAELAAKQNERQAAGMAAKDPDKARALLEPVDTPDEPTARRYVVNDATVEALQEVLMVNPWGLLVYRDELHGLLCSMDRQGQEGARGFYLTGYDGNQGCTVDRILRGIGQYIPRVCLAMLGGIQPGKVQSYVREAVAGGAGDDGLLQRFGLAVWPDVNRDFVYVDRWPDTPAKQTAWAVFERLDKLQPASDTEPQEWRFSAEAQSLFEKWLVPFETDIRGEELHPALVSHLAKYRKLVPALALIFALVDTPDSGNVIHERELVRALAWGDYLRTHADRLYAAAVMPETTGAKQLLDKIKAGKLTDVDGVLLEAFTPRQAAVKHWAGLNTPDAVRKAADLLADYGYLVRETVQSNDAMGRGRPSDRYLIHPKLLKGRE